MIQVKTKYGQTCNKSTIRFNVLLETLSYGVDKNDGATKIGPIGRSELP